MTVQQLNNRKQGVSLESQAVHRVLDVAALQKTQELTQANTDIIMEL